MSLSHSPKIVTDGLVLCLDAANLKSYPGSGTQWKDLSGLGNHATLVNGPTYSALNKGNLVFDGVNDFCSSVVLANSTGKLSCEICLNYASKGSYHNIFDRGSNNPMLWIRPTDLIELNASALVSSASYTKQNVVITATFNSVSSPGLQLYINGTLTNTSNTVQAAWPNPSTFTLFNRGGTQTLLGNVHFIRFYNKILTQAEITQNFNALRGRYGI